AVFEKASEGIKNSKSGKEASDVLLTVADKVKVLSERARELEKKYPDFKAQDNPELKAEMEKIQGSMQKFIQEVAKVSVKYAGDKDFQDALKKIGENMK
ncbi:MAG TPA: hypothetical protein VF857_11540, partial [Spirochaetota bacterium]